MAVAIKDAVQGEKTTELGVREFRIRQLSHIAKFSQLASFVLISADNAK
jgi:hypothetical protein